MSEWVAWHEQYQDGQPLARRLGFVQDLVRIALDASPPGPIRVISMCAGDGRDLLGVLPAHPRCADVHARLVELEPELAARARARASAVGGASVEVVCGDASNPKVFTGAVPADIALVCGIFGNISDADIHRTIEHLPGFCAPDATVIWTRGTFEPDLTPTIRGWFAAAGFTELSFVAIPDTTMAVGAHRLTSTPRPADPDARLFTFLAEAERPSSRARRS